MILKEARKAKTRRRHLRVRKKIVGTQERPRLSFHRSNKYIYVQLIDDVKGHTLLSASTIQASFKEGSKNTWSIEAAKKLGQEAAKNAIAKGIKSVVFDRGGFKYHGKVSAFAEGAREGGLDF